MRAVVVTSPGPKNALRTAEVPSPECGTFELKIDVAAAGVNRADLLQRRGLYPPPPGASGLLGLECAGTVAEVGDRVEGWSVGERVMALLPGGGYAEEATVPAVCAMRVPNTLDNNEAGAFPEVFLTAHLNIFMLGRLAPGETVLIHGGSGGVGTAAIQMVVAAGATAVVTAGSPERCRRCLELGASAAIPYRIDDFVERTRQLTEGRGANVVLDCVGGSYLERNLQALGTGGRLVIIGLMGGAKAELDIAQLLRRRLTIVGSTLRSRPVFEKHEIIEDFLARFGSAIADGSLRPIIDRALPLDHAEVAHQLLAAGEIFGKVVLEVEAS